MAAREEHPALAKNLVLIGGRGCGKSSVAKRLARCNRHFMLFSLDALIRYSFDQLDRLTGYAAGMPAPWFYQQVWERRDRAMEELGITEEQAEKMRKKAEDLAEEMQKKIARMQEEAKKEENEQKSA